MKCGTRRKRRSLEKVLDMDVYTEEMEKHHRSRRQAAEETACTWNIEGDPFTGKYIILFANIKFNRFLGSLGGALTTP